MDSSLCGQRHNDDIENLNPIKEFGHKDKELRSLLSLTLSLVKLQICLTCDGTVENVPSFNNYVTRNENRFSFQLKMYTVSLR